eukprot:m.132279 g.132279  ORF g.132279 m.132279 type:complete len:125 (+) comp13931_c1_seq1:385-759(+)
MSPSLSFYCSINLFFQPFAFTCSTHVHPMYVACTMQLAHHSLTYNHERTQSTMNVTHVSLATPNTQTHKHLRCMQKANHGSVPLKVRMGLKKKAKIREAKAKEVAREAGMAPLKAKKRKSKRKA